MPGSRKVIRRTRPPKNRDLEGLKNFWDKNYSGEWENSEAGQALANAFYAIYGDGSFHSGGVGGIDRQYDSYNNVMNEYGEFSGSGFNQNSPFGNRWFGKDEPLIFKEGGTIGMWAEHPEDVVGDKVTFKRDVSPYMMYHNPEDPTMWDEIPNPATPMPGEAGMHPEHMADPYREGWQEEYNNDKMEDLWRIAQRDRSRGNNTLSDILSRMQLNRDRMRRMASGRR